MDTSVSPVEFVATCAPPWLCNSGHPLHRCVAPAHGMTTSVVALMAPMAPTESLGAIEAPSLETRPPELTQKQSHLIQIIDTGSPMPSFRWVEVDPRKNGLIEEPLHYPQLTFSDPLSSQGSIHPHHHSRNSLTQKVIESLNPDEGTQH
jgi:hypothetical protein